MTEFKQLVLSAVVNAAVTSTVVSLAVFWFKSWVGRKIDSTFTILELRAKAQIEIEQKQALALIERRTTIYPEILEVVYRLRNYLRELTDFFRRPTFYLSGRLNLMRVDKESVELMRRFGGALSVLTENLYKYRAVVDEDVFDQLHLFKRELQDANVIVDRLTRIEERISPDMTGPANDEMAIYQSLADRLKELCEDCDTLYRTITGSIKATLEQPGVDRKRVNVNIN